MIRNFNIYINPEIGVISQTEGDGSFYLGDNNRITIIPDVAGSYYISVSGNIPGAGTYIAEATEQEDGSYIINSDDLNGFLVKVGKVNCNLHISNENEERLTTLAFQIESKLAYDREGSTVVAPTSVKDLNDFYIALDIVESLNIEEIEEAVEVVESLDIEKIEEALEITNTLNTKIEEVDETLASAKETETALNDTVEDINKKLEAGEFKGEKGDKGDKGDTGEQGPEGPQGPQGEPGVDGTMTFEDLTDEQKASLKGEKGDKGDTGEQGPEGPQGPAGADGNDYILTSDDKAEIANQVYAMFTNAEEVSF